MHQLRLLLAALKEKKSHESMSLQATSNPNIANRSILLTRAYAVFLFGATTSTQNFARAIPN